VLVLIAVLRLLPAPPGGRAGAQRCAAGPRPAGDL